MQILNFFNTTSISLQRCTSKEPDRIKLSLIPPENISVPASGIRRASYELENIVKRSLIYAYFSSATKKDENFCQSTGIILTASHNPHDDNGVKIISQNGKFIDKTEISQFEKILKTETFDFLTDEMGIVLVFRDTRTSGVDLLQNLKNTSELLNCHLIDCGIASTPLSNYIVYQFNKKLVEKNSVNNIENSSEVSLPSIDEIKKEYYESLKSFTQKFPSFFQNTIFYDSANGVSQNIIEEFENVLKKKLFKNVTPPNTLNLNSGAEYVKSTGVPESFLYDKTEWLFSFDGDMDRIISARNDYIFDGDDFLANFSLFILKTFSKINKKIRIGFIISDYTNFGCFEFLSEKKKKFENNFIEIEIIKSETGIANFIENGEKYDISTYFEPNGHGGIIFSENSKKLIQKLYEENTNNTRLRILNAVCDLFLPLVGDPLVILLFSKVIGIRKLFKKYPSFLKNIRLSETKNKEEIQKKLFENIENMKNIGCKNCFVCSPRFRFTSKTNIENRIFIRPSNTEPLMRIYMEGVCEERLVNICKYVDSLVE